MVWLIRAAPYLIYAALGAALVAFIWSWESRGNRIEAQEKALSAAQATIDAHEQAEAVLQAHYDRLTAETERWQRTVAELSQVEGVDEPLNDYERAVLDRVRAGN